MTMTTRQLSALTAFCIVISAVLISTTSDVRAQGIELLLKEQIPVPQPRPTFSQTAVLKPEPSGTLRLNREPTSISAIKGTLEQGLNAVSTGDGNRALAIRAGLKAGSLDRKIPAWAVALSGNSAIASSDIANIATDLSAWPGQKVMRSNVEKSLARENLSPNEVVSVFASSPPKSVEGATTLAKAYLALGNSRKANRSIAPFWRAERLDRKTEAYVLDNAGRALTRDDHRVRMHTLFYNDRITAAQRVQSKAEQVSLAKARAASIRKSSNASKLIKAVAPSSRRDPAYLFTRIEHARRSEQFQSAADLLLTAPSNEDALIDSGEWWVERRIVSRKMLEFRKPKLAYKLAADHASTEPRDIIEAEFHSGWYALRFLNDRVTARRHFARILQIAEKPLSRSRGHYWLARASQGNEARKHYRDAARHVGTFYGQLAAAELNTRRLSVRKPTPTPADRTRFKSRELVRAIVRLEGTDHAWRAKSIYRHLARTQNSPGEIALVAARAERRNDHTLSLQIGKIAFSRGFDVVTLSWPLGAIPKSASIGNTGRALAYAIARQESAFNKAAVSPANARGLLQLLPGTAKGVAKRNSLPYSFKRLTSDAAYNATLGAAYLSEQLEDFGNSYILTFAAYNAGPGRVDEWIGRFGDPRGRKLYDVIDWIEQIPFTETRHYVQRVMENYQMYKARIGGSGLTIEQDLVQGRR